MTQVGAILTGVTIGVICMPERKISRWMFDYFTTFSLPGGKDLVGLRLVRRLSSYKATNK